MDIECCLPLKNKRVTQRRPVFFFFFGFFIPFYCHPGVNLQTLFISTSFRQSVLLQKPVALNLTLCHCPKLFDWVKLR
ncbi:hypothetical protein DM01DRAFT_1398864 [Hesseltinella vesiculosa]|uniref:Uncharacterized protein n=1 Tax=Hesseltinella vesiculosa TaxID=101127 RepID=A0A1X2GQM6_9FUNG|nr:hypothetical protein DM01DRAFT_1398864 [Hesseltinella vesiculosa]